MGMAKRAAAAMDRALMQEERFHLLSRKFSYGSEVPLNPEPSRKNQARRLSVRDRVNNFNEISFGFTGEQARDEVSRCLRCDVKCEPYQI
jgi:NADH-quinone oxidoreductase subunit F